MKKYLSLLLILALLFSFALAEGNSDFLVEPETPVPAKIHEAPAPTKEPPMLVDKTQKGQKTNVQFMLDAKLLHIWFPIIQNADEAVLLYDGEVWLIDCGTDKMAANGVDLMNRLGITKIDKLFNSHIHPDHLDGLQVTNEVFPVKELFISETFLRFKKPYNETTEKALAYCETAGIPITQFGDGAVFAMGDGGVTLTFWVNDFDGKTNHLNDASAITMVQFGDRRILFMADMDKTGQDTFLRRKPNEDIHAEIVKYPHHGKHALFDKFYEKLKPSLAIVTNKDLGKEGDKWGVVPYMIRSKKIPVIYTGANEQYIHLVTDGHTWLVEYVKPDEATPIQ